MKPKLPPDKARVVLLSLFEKTTRPVLVGPACIALGPLWSLAETYALFESLVAEGRLRHLTDDERRRFDVSEGYLLV
jgi:hypothetical protein